MNNRVLSILAILIAIGIFFAYVRPTWNGSIAVAKSAIASDDSALVAASEYTSQQNELASARNAIRSSDLSRLTSFLPDSVDNVELILSLNALAARSGLSLSNIDVTTNTQSTSATPAVGAMSVSTTNPVSSVDVSLSAVGTYSALQTFLAGVERSERLLDVRDIVVKSSDTGVYNYQMTLRLYWLQ